jgi:hypothetical protein
MSVCAVLPLCFAAIPMPGALLGDKVLIQELERMESERASIWSECEVLRAGVALVDMPSARAHLANLAPPMPDSLALIGLVRTAGELVGAELDHVAITLTSAFDVQPDLGPLAAIEVVIGGKCSPERYVELARELRRMGWPVGVRALELVRQEESRRTWSLRATLTFFARDTEGRTLAHSTQENE